jgi:hypothetical protein
MALPALVGRPLLAAAFALPMVLMPPIAVIVFAILVVWSERTGRSIASFPFGRAPVSADGA